MKSYDFIVVGLGTAGSSTCMVLAQGGASVLGLDALHPPHTSGSHHGVKVRTTKGTYHGQRMLLAGGARNQELCGCNMPLFSKRIPVHWISVPNSAQFRLGRYPVNFWQVPGPDQEDGTIYAEFYSLPSLENGGRIKTAPHNNLADWCPDDLPESAPPRESEHLKRFLKSHIPALASADATVDGCYYNMTPDGDFIIDWLPQHDHVAIVALSGHGFKFAPVLGQMLADLLQDRRPEFGLDMFSLDRFSNGFEPSKKES